MSARIISAVMDVKIYARKKMKGQTAKTFTRVVLTVLFYMITGVFFLTAYFGFFRDVFPEGEALLLSWLSLAGGMLCLLLSSLYSFYAGSKIYYSLDRSQTRPKRVLTVRYAAKALLCGISVRTRKLLWAGLFFSPFLLSVYFAPSIPGRKGLAPVIAAAEVVLFLCGAVFYAVTSARYALTAYILYLNPLIPAREAVISSAKLSEGRLMYIAARRLSMLPWALAEFLLIPLPFAAVYRRYYNAVLCERIYGEDKRIPEKKSPAVTFYINKNSRFADAEGV